MARSQTVPGLRSPRRAFQVYECEILCRRDGHPMRSSARCAQLRGDLLWLGVHVANSILGSRWPLNDRNLWNIQAPLKELADGFMSKIMEV